MPGDGQKNLLLRKTHTTLYPHSWRTSFIGEVRVESKSWVRTLSGLTDWFQVTSGVTDRQGCVPSPLLFIIYMEKFKKEANPAPEALNDLLFSDDQSLINEDEKATLAWTREQSERALKHMTEKSALVRLKQWRWSEHQATLPSASMALSLSRLNNSNILAAFSHRMGA